MTPEQIDAALALCDTAAGEHYTTGDHNGEAICVCGNTAPCDLPAVFIAAARTGWPEALHALQRVLALHRPRTEVTSASSDPKYIPMTRRVCSFCGDNYGDAPYPCATVRAITGGTDE